MKYFTLIFPCLGVFLLIIGIALRRRLKLQLKGCERTTGEVIANVSGIVGGFDTSELHYPQIRFTVAGREHVIESTVGYGSKLAVGTRVKVMFLPANPAIACILDDQFAGANACIGIGATFVTFGGYIAYLLTS